MDTYEFVIHLIERWQIGPVGGLGWLCVGALWWERVKDRREVARHVAADVTATHELSGAVANVVEAMREMRTAVEGLRAEVVRVQRP